MTSFNRRRFLKTTAAASAAFPLVTIAGTKASGKVLGANDTVRIAVAGINGRGGSHIDGFAKQAKNAHVTYLVDPDSSLFGSRTKHVQDRYGVTPKCVQDVRAALEDKNLDAVSVATCNHWHSLITVWACQAGKDVYVEKPISHNVFEGRKCVEAAAKYKRVVQHGTQQRSDPARVAQIADLHSGKYGKLLVAKGYCCKPRWSIGVKPQKQAPAHLDFNLWLGPAPEQPYHDNLVHYNWHWFWDTGNGDIGNQGVHEMDVARWGIKDATLPNKVWSLGGRFLPSEVDQAETPNMLLSVYEYDDCLLVFETRGLVEKKGTSAPARKVANEFYTTEGVIKDFKFYPNSGGPPQPLGQGVEPKLTPGREFGSFVNSVRNRKVAEINCDAEVAHYSSALCHLGNISYRLGESARFNQKPRTLGDNRQVVEAFDNLRENQSVLDISLADSTYQLGRVLEFNPKTEQFTGSDRANALLTREYRQPFTVPAQV